MAIATYGSKQFVVSKNKVYTFDGLSYSQALNVENQDVEGKKPSTYIKGIGLIPLSFSVGLDARFVDVKAEIDWWMNKMLSKQPEVFTIGGKVISNNKFLLKSVTPSDMLIGKNGEFLKAKLDLEFEEFASSGYKKTTTTKKKTSSSKKQPGMSATDIKVLEGAMKK